MDTKQPMINLPNAVELYIDSITLARSKNTARSYQNALTVFLKVLDNNGYNLETTPIEKLTEDVIIWFASALKEYAPATERMYLTAVNNFYKFLSADRLADPNLPRLQMLIRQRSRRPGQRLPQFPRDHIEAVLIYAKNLTEIHIEDNNTYLRNLRDRAFLFTLADTGLRVHEACGLRRGDLDWNEGKAVIIGKGDREAVIRFSNRSIKALREYLNARAHLDGGSGRPLASLPIFSRHDKGAGKMVKPITTATGRNIVSLRVEEALGSAAVGSITPHSFRHYFVTTVLRSSGGNIKLAQELARHQNITVTQRYAHLSDDELDQGYYDIFDG